MLEEYILSGKYCSIIEGFIIDLELPVSISNFILGLDISIKGRGLLEMLFISTISSFWKGLVPENFGLVQIALLQYLVDLESLQHYWIDKNCQEVDDH